MDLTAIFTAVLTLLAGIGVFLIACQMMSSNQEAASSEKLKKLFSVASDNKLLGVGIGALGMFGGNSVSTSVIFSAFAGLGAFLSVFSKKSNAERIADHMINIAKSIKSLNVNKS